MDILAAVILALWLFILIAADNRRVAILAASYLTLYNALPLITQWAVAPTLNHEIDFAANGALSAVFASIAVRMRYYRLTFVFGTYYVFYMYCAFLSANNNHIMPDMIYYAIAYTLELALVGVSIGYNTESYRVVDTVDSDHRGNNL